MSEGAQVNSVEAIGQFRASLVVFVSKARAALEEALDEPRRLQTWLENDCRSYWQRELRRRQRLLDETQQELFRSKLSTLGAQTSNQVLAVERAKMAVRKAEQKNEAVKRWTREFENRAAPLTKRVEQLQTYAETDLGKAVASLAGVIRVLESYLARDGVDPMIVVSPISSQRPSTATNSPNSESNANLESSATPSDLT